MLSWDEVLDIVVKLEDMEALATPPPWRVCQDGDELSAVCHDEGAEQHHCALMVRQFECGPEDLEFIVRLRNVAPALFAGAEMILHAHYPEKNDDGREYCAKDGSWWPCRWFTDLATMLEPARELLKADAESR